jgi:hypothetical protein
VLEKWYPMIKEGTNKGIIMLITSQKEGAITGSPTFKRQSTTRSSMPHDIFLLHQASRDGDVRLLVSVFCTDKIWGGQDHVFLF